MKARSLSELFIITLGQSEDSAFGIIVKVTVKTDIGVLPWISRLGGSDTFIFNFAVFAFGAFHYLVFLFGLDVFFSSDKGIYLSVLAIEGGAWTENYEFVSQSLDCLFYRTAANVKNDLIHVRATDKFGLGGCFGIIADVFQAEACIIEAATAPFAFSCGGGFIYPIIIKDIGCAGGIPVQFIKI